MPILRTKNDDFFKTWTPEMAYVSGYFAADGNMLCNKRGAHYIEFQSTDEELIENVKRAFGSNHKISSKIRVVGHKRVYRIQIGSKKMFHDLMRLGFTPNKSKNIKFPVMPRKYLSHFVRGYFDGDGHVSSGVYKRSTPRKNPYIKILTTGFTSGSQIFLADLKTRLSCTAGLKGGTSCHISRAYRLNYSINDSRRLYEFMYTGVLEGLYLKRKKEKFEQFFDFVGR